MRPAEAHETPSDEPKSGSDPITALTRRLEDVARLVRGCHVRMGQPLSPEDVEEAIQETSLTAWRRRHDFRGDSDLDTWLYGIARFTIMSRIRQRQTRQWFEADLVGDVDHPRATERSPGTLADTGFARKVDQSFQGEGPTVTEICRRRILMGESFGRIGAELSQKEANVKARYYRSLPRLRQRLGGLWEELTRGA